MASGGSTYNYRVIVDVEVRTGQTASGTDATAGYLNRIRQQVVQVNEEIRRQSEITSNQVLSNIRAQINAYREMAEAAEAAYARIRSAAAGATNATSPPVTAPAGASPSRPTTILNQGRPFNNTLLDQVRPSAASPGGVQNARGDIQVLDSYIDKTQQLRAANLQGADAFGVWGRAFRGALVGAVAGIAFSAIIGGFTSLIRVAIDAGVAAVEAGARFQTTTKALEVFAGTTARARKELADISDTARDTAGLRLEPAEVGFTRLRALGFEANQARSFIKELGEEKILSGASDESLQRIIFNFAQIASGGQKVSQELREILTQMPSMRNAFIDAFGTLDPKKIQSFFDKNTDDAFKRLTDAMSRQRAASGGLEDSWGKLSDEVLRAGRQFAEPILDPLTTSVRGATGYVRENESAWKSLGETIGDVISAINNTPMPTNFSFIGAAYDAVGTGVFGNTWQQIKTGLNAYRQAGRNVREYQKFTSNLTEIGLPENFLFRPIADPKLFQKRRDQFWSGSFTDNAVNMTFPDALKMFPNAYPELDTFENRLNQVIQRRNKNQFRLTAAEDEQDKIREREQRRQQELALIDSYYAQVRSVRESAFAIEAAQVEGNAEKTYKATQANLQGQIEDAKTFYAQKIALSEGQDQEIIKLSIDRDNEIRRLETEAAVARINFEREQARIRREAFIENNNLLQREVEKTFEIRERELQRSIDKRYMNSAEGYDQMIRLVKERENILSQAIRDNYALRLQDKTLTDQQIVNLEKERDLEIADIQDQSLVRTREIEDAKTEIVLKNFEHQRQITREMAEETSRFLTNLSAQFGRDFFNPETFSSTSLRNFNEFVLKRPQRSSVQSQIDAQIRLSREASAGLIEFEKMNPFTDTTQGNAARLPFVDKIDKAEGEIIKLNAQLKELEYNIPKQWENFATLAEQIGVSADAFDKLNEAILEHRQERDRLEANKEVEYWKTLIEGEMKVAEAQQDQNKLREYRLNLLKAENREQELLYAQGVERAEQYRHSLAGINEEIQNLASGDSLKMGALKDIFDKQRGEEAINLLTRVRMLEFELSSPEVNAQYEQRAEILQHLLDIRKEESEVTTRILKAEIDIQRQFVYSEGRATANFAEFLASQKGITEIISDARINALTTAYDGLDAVAESLTKNFGAAGKAVQQLIADLLKLSLNWFVQKFMGGNASFGISGGGQGQSGIFGMPNILNGGGFGGFGGIGTVPFNPNAGIGFGGVPFMGGFGGGGMQTFPTPHETGHLLGAGLPQGQSGIFGGSGASSLIGMLGSMAHPAMLLPMLIPLAQKIFTTTNPAVGALGGLLGFGLAFWNRSRLRRKEEKVRNQAMVDAFRQIDELIDRVNRDLIDGASALASADQIRETYVQNMSQLTDRKTRDHALRDVSRIDIRIQQLKDAVSNQNQRRERLAQSIPTFGDGGSVSGFIGNNYSYNPLGYQTGASQIGYFPNAGMFASYNERGNEYILDAQTTRNVGVRNLDMLRQTKGQSFKQIQKSLPMPEMFGGGNLPPTGATAPSSGGSSSGGGLQTGGIKIVVQYGVESFVQVFEEMLNSSADKTVEKLVGEFRQGNTQELTDAIMKAIRAKGGKI